MRVYHFVNAHFGLENLERKRLKIARISELNDPFEWMAKARSKQERFALLALKETQNKKTGLICFSKNWSNPVQWSHYADRHKGICIGFDIPDSLANEVKYRSKPLEFKINEFKSNPDFAERFSFDLVTSKFKDWKYEQEIRVFVRLQLESERKGLYFCDFSKDLILREVIVGAASELSRAQIEASLGNLAGETRVRKARVAFQSFRIVEQKKLELWH